ncbi:MAG: 7TM-DISM domain-containing protein, partial [Flavobacteriaceae bacterium]|nr:7TM-DISM domain-containing protein [Flavobacteriaceae bacterium]
INLNEENSYILTNFKEKAKEIELQNKITTNKATFFNYGLYYGFALTLVLLNFVCFFLFEEKLFLFYSLAIAGITCALFYNDGLLSILGINLSNNLNSLESILLLFAIGFSSIFASKYLSLEEFFPKLKYITSSLLGAAALLIVASFISESNNYNLTFIAKSILLSVMGLYFLAGVSLFSRKNYAKFYVIAYSIPLLFALDYYIISHIGVSFLNTETIHLKIATLFEILLLTFAIMYRMKAVKEENELRQTEMRIFLKRQDMMSRDNVEKIIQDVYLENLIMQYDLDGLEIKLLQYISEGKSNEKIVRKLKLTEHELEKCTKELYEKLEISEHIQEDYRLVNKQPDYIYN